MVFGRRSESGQALLIAMGILLILFVSIPIIIFVNMSGISHQTRTQRQEEGRAIAQEGISYAAQYFAANQPAWQTAAETGNFSSVFTGSGCNSLNVVPGTHFKLTCSDSTTNSQLQPYQVQVIATAWLPGPNGQTIPSASLQAVLSQKTVGAFLENGIRAGAALGLVQVPSLFTGNLDVHWGPIVCLDDNKWVLTGDLDTYTSGTTFQGFPRKFSNGGITGTGSPPLFIRCPDYSETAATSDQLEYWAYAAMTPPPAINDSSYTVTAAGESNLNIPHVNGTSCGPIGDGSGIFNVGVPGCTAIFDNTFTVPSNTVIYVNGNAKFDQLRLDLQNGAFIINGTLELSPNQGIGLAITYNIPSSAPREYPYWPTTAGTQWPCSTPYYNAMNAQPPTLPTCTSGLLSAQGYPANVNFRGFLWAKGGLQVDSGGSWVMAGVIQVGDPLTNPTATLSGSGNVALYYDAGVNGTIITVAH
jgi:hypothetical protein